MDIDIERELSYHDFLKHKDEEDFSIFMRIDRERQGHSLFGVNYFNIYLDYQEEREDTLNKLQREHQVY